MTQKQTWIISITARPSDNVTWGIFFHRTILLHFHFSIRLVEIYLYKSSTSQNFGEMVKIIVYILLLVDEYFGILWSSSAKIKSYDYETKSK